MTTNPVTEQLAADVDACRPYHRCTGQDCYTCVRARGLAAQLATDLPDTDLRTTGEILLHSVHALDGIIRDALANGAGYQAAISTAIWAACQAATTLYRSPAIPDGIDA